MRLNWNNVGKGLTAIAEAKTERELAEEAKRLKQKMADGTTYTADGQVMPDRQTAENVANYNNDIVAQDEATFGEGLSSANKTKAERQQSYTRADYYSDLGNKATAMGLTDRGDKYLERSEELRDKDWQRGRQEKADARAEESHGLNMKTGNLELGEKERVVKQRTDLDTGLAEISGMTFETEADRAKAVTSLYGKVYGEEKALEMGQKYTAQDIAAMQLRSMQLKTGLEDGIRSGGVDGAAKWYDSVNNGLDVKVVRGKKGIEIIEYDPKDPQGTARVKFKGTNENDILMNIQALATPGGAMELAKFELDRRKTEAEIQYKDRTGQAAMTSAAAKGDYGTKGLTRLQAQQTYLSKQLSSAKENLQMLKAGTPEHADALRATNEIGKQLFAVEKQVGLALGMGGEQSTGGGAYAPGDVMEGEGGVKYRFKGGANVRENWEPVGDAPSAPATKPAAKRETEAEVTARVSAKQNARAEQDRVARIERLKEIIASPTYSMSKGLVNNPSGASLESTKIKAQRELEQLTRGR